MPLYQYRTADGSIVEAVRTVAERDNCPPGTQRVTVPVRVGCSLGLLEPHTAAHDVPKAFREYELSGASAGQIERETGFSRDHIRKVWAFCLAFLLVVFGVQAADMSTGHTWADGDSVTAANLNLMVNDATILAGFYTGKTYYSNALANDTILLWSAANGLYKSDLSSAIFLNTNLIWGATAKTSPMVTTDTLLLLDGTNNTMRKMTVGALYQGVTNLATVSGAIADADKLLLYQISGGLKQVALWQALTSAWQVVTIDHPFSAVSNSVSHGLGRNPLDVHWVMRANNPDVGFPTGSQVELSSFLPYSGTDRNPLSASWDTTYFRVATPHAGILLTSPTGSSTQINPLYWDLYIYFR